MEIQYSPKYAYLDVTDVTQVENIINSFGFQRICLVVDSGIKNQFLINLRETLDNKFPFVSEYLNNSREPLTTDVDKLVDFLLTEDSDCLVVVGGGSTLDLAKAAAVVAKLGLKAIDFQGVDFKSRNKIFTFVIPTNAGSGAEATKSAVLFNPKTGIKRGINNVMILPDAVILCTPLLDGLPNRSFIAAIFDGFTHALESYIGNSSTLRTRALSVEAMQIYISQFLDIAKTEVVMHHPDILKASFYAGSAICNSETGPVHAISYPLSEYLSYSHGEAISCALVPVLKSYLEKNLAILEVLLEFEEINTVDEFFDLLLKVKEKYLLYPKVESVEIDVEKFATRSLELKGAIQNSPINWTHADSVRAYEEIFLIRNSE